VKFGKFAILGKDEKVTKAIGELAKVTEKEELERDVDLWGRVVVIEKEVHAIKALNDALVGQYHTPPTTFYEPWAYSEQRPY
jgi:hypothetical protein